MANPNIVEQTNATDSDWFELKSERKPRMRKASWIPLYRDIETKRGEWPATGYTEECALTRTAIFPAEVAGLHEKVGWNDVYRSGGDRPEAAKLAYLPARRVWNHHLLHDDEPVDGELLVFEHHTAIGVEVFISPDLICALRLERTETGWAYPNDGYSEVIQELRRSDGTIHTVEIRAEYLKDYLCARFSQLVAATYRHRRTVQDERPDFDHSNENRKDGWYEFGFREIDDDGGAHGVPLAFSIFGFKETDHDDDVPSHGFGRDDEMWTERGQIESRGPERFLVESEMVLVETVLPAVNSIVVRRDKLEPTAAFIVDNSGSRQTATDLVKPEYGWVWFSPAVVPMVLSHRHSGLRWLSRDTAMLSLNADVRLHIGVNRKQLVNVFGKDVGELPAWWQERFVSHNVPPDGGVCPELTAAQRESRGTSTVAPEVMLKEAVDKIDELFEERFGRQLFVEHQAEAEMWRGLHRFASLNDEAFFELAKNAYRLVIERLDGKALKSVTPEADKEDREIKRLEALVTQSGGDGRSATTVLVGLNELRQHDSHLPSRSGLAEAYEMAGVDATKAPVSRAETLLGNIGNCLETVANAIKNGQGNQASKNSLNFLAQCTSWFLDPQSLRYAGSQVAFVRHLGAVGRRSERVQ